MFQTGAEDDDEEGMELNDQPAGKSDGAMSM